METISLIEIYQPHILAEAEAARVKAEQALRKLETEADDERAKTESRINCLRRETPGLLIKLQPLLECIQMKERARLDCSSDKAQLEAAQTKYRELENELKETIAKRPAQEAQTRELSAGAKLAFDKAYHLEKAARARIGKAIAAHEAYQADLATGVGPIPKFKTLKEAIRHFCKLGFELTDEGAAYHGYIDDQIHVHLMNGAIRGMVPESLSWLGRFDTFASLPCPQLRTHIIGDKLSSEREFQYHFGPRYNRRTGLNESFKILCYIEDSGIILANHAALRVTMPGKTGAVDFSDLFGAWDSALATESKELASHGTLDLASQGKLPMLGEVIREAWHVAAASLTSKSNFHIGQGRLSESQINKLIGAYWKAFIDSPWEPTIEGTYALLKHRCARGEIPNVYSFDIQGHFGFRTRTPDHDWIIGEIYCPPGNFSPDGAPDPAKVINLGSYGDEWLAELGPVKLCIRKTASRT